MNQRDNEGSHPPTMPRAGAALLCRVHFWSSNTMVMTLPPDLRKDMGLVAKDVIAFRVIMFQGRRIMVGEKVPLTALANLKVLPPELIP